MPTWQNKIATPSRITCCMPQTTPRVMQYGSCPHDKFGNGAPSIGTSNVKALHINNTCIMWVLMMRVFARQACSQSAHVNLKKIYSDQRAQHANM